MRLRAEHLLTELVVPQLAHQRVPRAGEEGLAADGRGRWHVGDEDEVRAWAVGLFVQDEVDGGVGVDVRFEEGEGGGEGGAGGRGEGDG